MAQTPLLAYICLMVFIELPIFVRCAEDLFTDEDITKLQLMLLRNPSVGALIPRGRGLRKLRVPLPGRGKRGGARVIYYHWVNRDLCYLIYAYAKNAASDLTREQLHHLAAAMAHEVDDE